MIVKKAAVVLPALACNMFLDIENQQLYGDLYNTDDRTISWSLNDDDDKSPDDKKEDLHTRYVLELSDGRKELDAWNGLLP